MRVNAKTPEGRLRQFAILRAREHGHDPAWVREVASRVVGRRLVEGFGLTTCTKVELVRIGDEIVRLTGGVPGQHRPGPQRRRGAEGRRGGNITQIASVEQHQLIRALQEEMRMSEDELAGISRKACGHASPRTVLDAIKLLQALHAVRSRRMVAAAQEAQAS